MELSVPERGKRRALALMACENAAEEIARRASAARKSGKALAELGELVGLSVRRSGQDDCIDGKGFNIFPSDADGNGIRQIGQGDVST